jgi:hypothetical protein
MPKRAGRFDSPQLHAVMSRDIPDSPKPPSEFGLLPFSGSVGSVVSRPGFDAVLIPWSKGCGEGDCCHGTSVEVHARVPSSSC